MVVAGKVVGASAAATWLLRPFDSHLTHLLCVVSHLAVRLTLDSGELTHHSHLTHIYLLTTDSLRTHLAKTPRLFYSFKIEISAIVSPKSSKFQEVTRLAEKTVPSRVSTVGHAAGCRTSVEAYVGIL